MDLVKTTGEEPKGGSMFDSLKEQAFMNVIDTILPKLQPFIEPAEKKLEDYFGQDSKIFVMRKAPNNQIQVIVFDNTKSNYRICNEMTEDGTRTSEFKAGKEAVIAVFDVSTFIQRLLGGEFTKIG